MSFCRHALLWCVRTEATPEVTNQSGWHRVGFGPNSRGRDWRTALGRCFRECVAATGADGELKKVLLHNCKDVIMSIEEHMQDMPTEPKDYSKGSASAAALQTPAPKKKTRKGEKASAASQTEAKATKRPVAQDDERTADGFAEASAASSSKEEPVQARKRKRH